MIALGWLLLAAGTGLLVAGLVTGAPTVLVASVVVTLAALVPLGVAMVRARGRAAPRRWNGGSAAPDGSGAPDSSGASDPEPG